MLTVTRRQTQVIVAQRLESLARRVAEWLERAPAGLPENSDRLDRIRALMVDAQVAGMRAETDFALYAWLALRWPGTETAFRADPEVARILASDWRPEAKLVRITAIGDRDDEAEAHEAV